MKLVLIGLISSLVISTNAIAYQAKIHNEYGKVVGYVKEYNEDRKHTEVVDRYGNTQFYIENNEILGDKDDYTIVKD